MLSPSATFSRMKSTVEMWSSRNSSIGRPLLRTPYGTRHTWCEHAAHTRYGNYLSGPGAAGAAEQPLWAREQDEDKQGKDERVAEAAIDVGDAQHAQQADQERGQDGAADTRHAAHHDHGEPGELDLAAHRRLDAVEGQPEQRAGGAGQRARHEESLRDYQVGVDPEQASGALAPGDGADGPPGLGTGDQQVQANHQHE